VLATPPRGIGAGTLATLAEVARARRCGLVAAAHHAVEEGLLPARATRRLREFLELIEAVRVLSADALPADALDHVVREVDYASYLDRAYAEGARERLENVRALVSAAAEYAEETEAPTVQGFLDRSALVADADDVGRGPGVTLMTIHCAKGLEFSHVFLAGLEENLFPHAMSTGSDDDLEEERRLCYVALTRARRRLALSHARYRRFQGALLPNPPSRFIAEIPAALVEEVETADDDLSYRGGAPWQVDDAPGSSAARAAVARPPAVRLPPPPRGPVVPQADGYTIGARVRHPQFGTGKILTREGAGRNLKLTIDFSVSGVKTILPAYTRLQVELREPSQRTS
jgi:DNA helicase-2/ATP-dependent DNA helicase PcrA